MGLYAVEGYLSLKSKKVSTFKKMNGIEYDKRDTFEIYQDLKKNNPNIVVSPHPVYFTDNFEISPLSGIANRTTLHCNENGYYSIYESDRFGFNNPDGQWDKNIIDFLLVGDSMTRGACVNEPDTISGNLKKKIKTNNGILNLGQSGNGPLRMYATLREYLDFKRVKNILWIYYEGNDLKEFNSELNHKILINYLYNENFTQKLVLRNEEIQNFLLNELSNLEQIMISNQREVKKLKRHPITSFLILTNIRIYISNVYYNKKHKKMHKFQKDQFIKTLNMTKNLSQKNDSKLYFIYLPSYSRFLLFNNTEEYMNYKKVIDTIKSLKISIIDINSLIFNKHKDPLSLFPFRENGHYTAEGYKLVAHEILKSINNMKKN